MDAEGAFRSLCPCCKYTSAPHVGLLPQLLHAAQARYAAPPRCNGQMKQPAERPRCALASLMQCMHALWAARTQVAYTTHYLHAAFVAAVHLEVMAVGGVQAQQATARGPRAGVHGGAEAHAQRLGLQGKGGRRAIMQDKCSMKEWALGGGWARLRCAQCGRGPSYRMRTAGVHGYILVVAPLSRAPTPRHRQYQHSSRHREFGSPPYPRRTLAVRPDH